MNKPRTEIEVALNLLSALRAKPHLINPRDLYVESLIAEQTTSTEKPNMWMYLLSNQGDGDPHTVNLPGDNPFVILPDGTRLYCKDVQGARAVTEIIRLFVIKQEVP